jgi:CheY-like chemotaxis protein
MTQASRVNVDHRSLNILLVDDDEFLLEIMRATLSDMNVASIQVAKNGLEGLSVFKNSEIQPNMVICDLCMPQLGGMEFLNHLAREGCQADIFIMSGHNLIPPKDTHWNLGNYNGPVLNLAEKLARIQGLKVRASFEKPITRDKIVEMLDMIGHAH